MILRAAINHYKAISPGYNDVVCIALMYEAVEIVSASALRRPVGRLIKAARPRAYKESLPA